MYAISKDIPKGHGDFKFYLVNNGTADTLVSCGAKTSAAILLIMQGIQVIVFHK